MGLMKIAKKEGIGMKVYHMSDTLPLNTIMAADYKETMELVMPFLQALERSEDCFFAMLMAAKHQKAVLKKFVLTGYVDELCQVGNRGHLCVCSQE